MDPVTIANLIAQSLSLSITAYNQIQAANANAVKSIEEALADADLNWDAIASIAAAQIAKDKAAIAAAPTA
jgi:cobalamin biosynthesis protein CbiG